MRRMRWASCGNPARLGAHRRRARPGTSQATSRAGGTHHGNETVTPHGRGSPAPPARQGHAGQCRTGDLGRPGGGRRVGQGIRRTPRPQGRPDGAEDGRAGAAVLAECEHPARSQPTPGNQEVARVTTLAAHGVWQHTQLCEGERPYAMSRLAVAEPNRRCAPILLTAAERSATL